MSASAAEKSDEAEEKLASPWDEEISGSTRPVEPIKHVFSNRDARGSANQTVRCRISRARFWAFIFSRERRPTKKSSLHTWPSARRAKRVSAQLAGAIEIDIRRASRVAGARVRSAPRAPAPAFLNPRREKNNEREGD
jgi:hypothetical protein